MTWLRVLCVLSVLVLPSCFVYDESLLGERAALGTGGQGDGGAAVGGGINDGGQGSGSGTGSGGDGSGGDSNDGSGGGQADGGSGNSGGAPSMADCDLIGTTGEFSGVGAVTLVDDFEVSWRFLNGSSFTGQWFATGDGSGTTLSPNVDDWQYAERACAPGEHALHVVASGFTTWGVSYDARLWEGTPPEAGVSEFAGIVFWARSELPGTALKVALTDLESETTREVNVPPLTATWKQYKVALSAFTAGGSLDLTKVSLLQIVGVAAEEIDFWIDDLSFYED